MKIADHIKNGLADTDPAWADASADLAHAVFERATTMSLPEMRAFVAGTSKGDRLAKLSDKELLSTTAILGDRLAKLSHKDLMSSTAILAQTLI